MKKIAWLILLGNALFYHTISFSDVIQIKCPDANKAMSDISGSYNSAIEKTIWTAVFYNDAEATLGFTSKISLNTKWSPVVLMVPINFPEKFSKFGWGLEQTKIEIKGNIVTCTFKLIHSIGQDKGKDVKTAGNPTSTTSTLELESPYKNKKCNLARDGLSVVCHD